MSELTGITSEYDIQDDLFIRKDTQDVSKIIEQNKAERNAGLHESRHSEMRKVATIPLIIVQLLKNRPMSEGGPIDLNLIGTDVDHAVRFNKWLNDGANLAFRTSESRQ